MKFEKHDYVERMRFDENGKVVNWDFHMARRNTSRFADVRAAAARLGGVAHRTPVVTSRTLDRALRRAALREVREPSAHGRLQVSRRVQFLVVAFAGGTRARRRRVLERQSRAGRRAGGAAARHSRDDRHADRCTGGQAGGDARVRRRDRATTSASARIAKRSRAASRRSAARRSCRRSTMPRIVAGAGTAALELLEDAGPLDAIVVPVGGGGLIGGTAIAAHGVDASIAIYGVEPQAGDDFAQSLARGERVTIAVPKTIADGLQTTVARRADVSRSRASTCARVVTVSDDELRDAMRFAFERMKLVVEPSGAAALAALLERHEFPTSPASASERSSAAATSTPLATPS